MRAERDLSKLIKSIENKLDGKIAKSANAKDFIQRFFGQAIVDDLARYDVGSLTEMANAAFEFAATRKPGRHKLRLLDLGHDGEADTVIEILNDDMPFLVDSVLGLLSERGIEIELVLHPLLFVHRDGSGKLKQVLDRSHRDAPGIVKESFIHIHIRRIAGNKQRKALENELSDVLKDIRTVVLDWRPMVDRLKGVVAGFQSSPPPVPVDELAESIQFLDWLADNHFTLLGIREYAFVGGSKAGELQAVPDSGLGILRDPDVQVLRRAGLLVSITPEVRDFLMQPAPLIITKANVRATVHRRVHMDYIGIKRFDEKGKLTGEVRLVGLFTSAAYTRSPSYIPMLRRKIAYVVEQSGFNPESHSGKALLNVLESYPRDELFQIDPETLLEFAIGILQLDERPRTRIFARYDKFDRFVSALVFIPRDRFNTAVRKRVADYLTEIFDGRISAFYPAFPEGALVRIHYIVGRNETPTPQPEMSEVEAAVAEIVRTWDDHLEDELIGKHKVDAGTLLVARYRDAFSAAYQEAFAPGEALGDIARMERIKAPGDLTIDFHRLPHDADTVIKLKLYHVGAPIPLSDRLPILENMGLRAINERSYLVNRAAGDENDEIWMHDIVMETADGSTVDLDGAKDVLEACFLAVWHGEAESDGYNTLALRERIGWRDIAMLRTISRYLRQAAIPFSNVYMWSTLLQHSSIASMLVELFHVRFNPANEKGRDKAEKRLVKKIETALDQVSSLNEDRVLRRFTNLVTSALRTNFFQPDDNGRPKSAIAIKIDSSKVDSLPAPRPFAEIFVYSTDVEGIHLRGGMIARGGLRWSDRPEDFRTEVLGLAKAQQVKNAVIVPVGAKGGFVPKKLPMDAGREAIQEEAIRCYKIFISSLLDVTDNLQGEKVVPPLEVVRHDGDDPYLVVAADKGTATFSDIANGISEDRGHWLGDAFASGGSAGYDHKKMGITARGGWEAVKRHFREMDIDIQSTPFTVVGCGDMSGDVFGNGMLLSKKIKLVAAFDHRDIFLDPDPDPAESFVERKRIFGLARSSWRDYSEKLISKGGGIHSRSDKSISLTPEVQALLKIEAKQATPTELIQALLKAPSDLLWFGGIGTYIRATTESNADAGDRANDSLRITAPEVGAQVIGEGANLGLTHRARIEFASVGGRVNTDAVDNSAGVNSSDIEVNIKIALGAAEAAGKLTRKVRNKLLADMTDEVAALVLRNNYQQTLSLTLMQVRSLDDISYHARFMRDLEGQGLLDREIEFLPDDATMADREAHGVPLTRPELAVLLAYAKITLYDKLLASKVPDDRYLGAELNKYFPVRLQKKFPDEIAGHKLRREIIATMLANSMINRGGATLINRLMDETGADVAEIAAAFAMARDSFGLTALNGEIDQLDNKISSETQIGLYLDLQEGLRRQTAWFLRNASMKTGLEKQIIHYRTGLETLAKHMDKVLPKEAAERVADAEAALIADRVPKALAARIARLRYLARGPDIVLVATQTKRPVEAVASVFFGIGVRLGVDQLAARAGRVEVSDYFDRLALGRAGESMFATQRSLVAEILRGANSKADPLAAWAKTNAEVLERTERAMSEMIDSGDLTLAKVAVAGSYLQDLLEA